MSTATLTNEDREIYSRLSMWNGDEAYQYANSVDADSIDYRAMLVRVAQSTADKYDCDTAARASNWSFHNQTPINVQNARGILAEAVRS